VISQLRNRLLPASPDCQRLGGSAAQRLCRCERHLPQKTCSKTFQVSQGPSEAPSLFPPLPLVHGKNVSLPGNQHRATVLKTGYTIQGHPQQGHPLGANTRLMGFNHQPLNSRRASRGQTSSESARRPAEPAADTKQCNSLVYAMAVYVRRVQIAAVLLLDWKDIMNCTWGKDCQTENCTWLKMDRTQYLLGRQGCRFRASMKLSLFLPSKQSVQTSHISTDLTHQVVHDRCSLIMDAQLSHLI